MRSGTAWCWLDRVADRPNDAWAAAEVRVDGAPAGHLAAWPAGRKPTPTAVRADARIVDTEGEPAAVSLVLVPRGRAPLFDDPAVSGALRRVLAGPPPDAVSTLVRDSSHFAGAVTVRRDGRSLRDDPFARIAHADVLDAGPGLFGRVAPVPGPAIQRYSGKPWPAAGF
ncbi:MAG: hypothetical protein ACRDWY_06815 [Actinomycetes bacterium]